MSLRRRGYLGEATGKTLNWGFDHTEFRPGDWEKLAKLFKLKFSKKPRKFKDYKGNEGSAMEFFWKGPYLEVQTYYNPATGESPRGGIGQDRGFAGYIGITGRGDKVMGFVERVKKMATGIKDESPREREFI